MNSKAITVGPSPVTQSRDAVVSMLKSMRKPFDPLPSVVELTGDTRLILSSKKDCYYVTTKDSCSCPGFTYWRRCTHTHPAREETPVDLMDLMGGRKGFKPVLEVDGVV